MTYSICQNMSCNAANHGASFAARALSVLVSIALAMLIFVISLLPLLVVILSVAVLLVVVLLVHNKNQFCPTR